MQSGTVTLVFADLVNAAEIFDRADEEAQLRLIREHRRLLGDAVNDHGGQDVEWLEESMLAAFHSTADAVRCAINIEQVTNRPVAGVRLGVSIGIHLGEVRRDGGHASMPAAIARRLCEHADSGQILCSQVVADLLASREAFHFRDLGDVQLKGITHPMAVCEVVYEHDDPAALLKRTPFVGRAAELRRLTARLQGIHGESGAVVLLSGEPGIGKSRLIEEFATLARAAGATVAMGACFEGEWQAPYEAFAEAMLDCARHIPARERESLLGRSVGILARIAPALADLADGAAEEGSSLDREDERLRLFDAVGRFFAAVSRRSPLVLVLDDLHWAERGTIALLGHIARFVPGNPILLIAAYRDAEVDRQHPLSAILAAITRQPDVERISLAGLGDADVGELVSLVEGDAATTTALREAAGGNPLFIRELLLHLAEEKRRAGPADGRAPAGEVSLPEGVRQIVRRRLLRLSPEAMRFLGVAAALRGEFSFEIAAAAADLDEDTGLRVLDEALNAQLLRTGASADRFDFAHTVIRSTLYADLNAARRVRTHRRIADTMERIWGERAKTHAAEIAYQYWRSAGTSGADRGVDYAIAAATNAESAYAFDEATAFLRIVLDLLPADDSRRPHLVSWLGLSLVWSFDAENAVKVVTDAGTLIAAASGADAAADYLEKAATAMSRAGLVAAAWQVAAEGLRLIGDRRDLTWASLDEIDAMRVDSQDPAFPGTMIDTPRLRERRAVIKRLPPRQVKERIFARYPYDSRAEIMDDPEPDPLLLVLLGGDCRRGLVRWLERAGDEERRGRRAMAMQGWAMAARCHLVFGELPQARAAFDRARSLSVRFPRPSLQFATVIKARHDFVLALDEGWAELAVAYGDRAPAEPGRDVFGAAAEIELLIRNPAPELRWFGASTLATVAHAMAHEGLHEQALALFPAILEALRRGAPWGSGFSATACEAATTLWLLGETDGLDVVEATLREKVLMPDFRYPMCDARLSLARLAALGGRFDEAAGWFAEARRVLDESGWRCLRAVVDHDEGLMHLRRGGPGDGAKARPLIAAAAAEFRAIGLPGWILRAEESALAASALA